MIGEIGIYIIAPTLSTLTAGALAYAGKQLITVSKIQKNIIWRVEQNEESIEELEKNIKQIREHQPA